MQDTTIHQLFSKPLTITELDLPNYLPLETINWTKNTSNERSEYTKVLQKQEWIPLRDKIQKLTEDYLYKVMKVSTDTKIYITESWFNRTMPGQMHHRHYHPNSYISGILYLQTDPKAGGETVFYSPNKVTVFPAFKEPTPWNVDTFTVEPKPGRLAMFPSIWDHSVNMYYGENPRITLSWNTFVRGYVNPFPTQQLSI